MEFPKTIQKALQWQAAYENIALVAGGIYKYLLLKRLDLHSRYNGGWVLITGASAGIGRAYALELAREGFNVCMIARKPADLEKAANDVIEAGAKAGKKIEVRQIVYDYKNLDSLANVHEYMKMLEEKTSDLDISILINNVGYAYLEDFVKDSVAE